MSAALGDPMARASLQSFLSTHIGDAQIAQAIIVASERHGLDPSLITALAWQESRFNPRAKGVNTNRSVDRGLMQLNSSTFPQLSEAEFFDPVLNTDLGTAYLRECLDKAGNEVAALAMYNAGPTRVGTTGAPHSTLNYIHRIQEYRKELLEDYTATASTRTLLASSEILPTKSPDILAGY